MNPRLPWLIAGSALCAAGLVVLMNRDLEHGELPANDKAGSQAQRSISGVGSAKDPAAQREARIQDLIDRFQKLQESSPTYEEEEALVKKVCRELLFSPEMDQLLSEMERRGMENAKQALRSQLQGILWEQETKAEAVASLIENPHTINHFLFPHVFIRAAVYKLPDEEFEKLKAGLGPLGTDYQNQAQFYYHQHHIREDSELHFMEGFKLLDWENEQEFATHAVSELIYQFSTAGRNIPYEQVLDQVHEVTAADPDSPESQKSRYITLSKMYHAWASKDPQAALDHAQKTSAVATYIKELATSVYQRKDSQEIVQWLDSIQDEATAEQARYIVARGLNADPVLSRIIAEGISDPERRAAAFKAIEAHERIRERRDARDFGTKIE